jgi:hypothetical protein
MRASVGGEPAEERVSRFVLNQVMRQNAGRLLGVDLSKSSRAQVPDQTTQRRSLPDKPASPCPRHEVDMHVGGYDAGCGPRRLPGPHARYCAEAASGEERQKTAIKTVPRRRQNRESANFKERC